MPAAVPAVSPLNRAAMRDQLRRMLQIVPPIDQDPPGLSGETPTQGPDPSNAVLNNALDRALSRINRLVRLDFDQTFNVPVTAAGESISFPRGPFFVDLSTQPTVAGLILEVHAAIWVDGTTNAVVRLEDYSRGVPLGASFQMPPGVPQGYYMAGYQVALLPPPVNNGTLAFTFRQSLPPIPTDSDTYAQVKVPYDFQLLWLEMAIIEVGGLMTMNAEMKARVDFYAAQVSEGLPMLASWGTGWTGYPIPAQGVQVDGGLPQSAQGGSGGG